MRMMGKTSIVLYYVVLLDFQSKRIILHIDTPWQESALVIRRVVWQTQDELIRRVAVQVAGREQELVAQRVTSDSTASCAGR